MTQATAPQWTLPEQPHHMWELRGPQATADIAQALLETAEAAIERGNVAVQLSRSMPAIGAYLAATKMLETALETLSQVQRMDLSNPGELLNPTGDRQNPVVHRVNRLAQDISDTHARLIQTIQSQENRLNHDPALLETQGGWYAACQHRIIRQEWARKALREFQDTLQRRQNPDADFLEAKTSLIYQVAVWPDQSEYPGHDYPVLQEPDPTLGAQARQADRNRDEDLVSLLTPLNQRASTSHTDTTAMCPELRELMSNILLPPNGPVSGITKVNPQPETQAQQRALHNLMLTQEPGEPGESVESGKIHLAWIAFLQDGVRHVKAVYEPYPHNYPQQAAAAHVTQLALTLRKGMETGQETPGLRHFMLSSMASEGASAEAIHDLGLAQAQAVATAAKEHNLQQAESAEMLRRTAQDNPLAQLYLSLNFGQLTRLENPQTAAQIIEQAKGAGAHHDTLVQLALAMGYRPSELGLPHRPKDQHTQTSVARRALADGLPMHLAQLLPQPPELPADF